MGVTWEVQGRDGKNRKKSYGEEKWVGRREDRKDKGGREDEMSREFRHT